MQPVPNPILKSFEAILEKRAISPLERANYKKWLRYFLDFCAKYPVPEAPPDRVRLFIDKLREKKQTPFQQDQVAHAVSLYFEMLRKGEIQVADSHACAGLLSGTDVENIVRSGTSAGRGTVSLLAPRRFRSRIGVRNRQRPPHSLRRHSPSLGVVGKTVMPLHQHRRNGMLL